MIEYLDIYGYPQFRDDAATDDMTAPVRCNRCSRGVYDLGTVEVTARYTDCSMWKAPCCGALVDDRGETGWTTRKDYERIERRGTGREWRP